MNVRRGLFRLWIVLSAIYIATVIVLGWAPVEYEIDRWRQNPSSGDPGQLIGSLFGIALIPPLIVLAIGAALVWAFSGFARSPSRQPD